MSIFNEYPRAVMSVAAVVLLVAVINLLRPEKLPKGVEQQFSALYKAWVTQAQQLGDVLEDGSRVVVMDFDRELLGFDRGEYKRALNALKDTGISIEHLEKIYRASSGDWDLNQSGFPYSEFVRIAEKYPDVDGVIAFCGVPYFPPHFNAPDPSDLPKLLVAAGPVEGPETILRYDEGWVYAASVPREGEPEVYDLLKEE